MKHNFLHWLVVVGFRTIGFFITAILSSFLAIGGFWLSERVIPFSSWPKQIPYIQLIKDSFLPLANQAYFQEAPSWRALVVGLPLILLAISIFLINLFNLYYSLFSSTYNRTHCPFCKTS